MPSSDDQGSDGLGAYPFQRGPSDPYDPGNSKPRYSGNLRGGSVIRKPTPAQLKAAEVEKEAATAAAASKDDGTAEQTDFVLDITRFQNDAAYRAYVESKLKGWAPNDEQSDVAAAPTVESPPVTPVVDAEQFLKGVMADSQAAYLERLQKRKPVDPDAGRYRYLHVPPPTWHHMPDGEVIYDPTTQIVRRDINKRFQAMNHQMDANKEMKRGDRLTSFDFYHFTKGKHAMPIFTESMRALGLTRAEFEADLNRFKTAALSRRWSKGVRTTLKWGGLLTMGGTFILEDYRDGNFLMEVARKEMNQRNRELFSQGKPWQWRLEFVQGIPNTWEGSLFYSPLD